MTSRCVICGAVLQGAFYMGLPGWSCSSHEPPLVGGPGPDLALLIGGGQIVIYRRGDYWGTLWAWLTGRLDEDERD